MTKEELLKPRFKVIADYPGSYLTVGEILTCDPYQKNLIAFYTTYPHLFKKLEWWENRNVEDIKYFRNRHGVWKVEKPIYEYARFNMAHNFTPATEEEYNAQPPK